MTSPPESRGRVRVKSSSSVDSYSSSRTCCSGSQGLSNCRRLAEKHHAIFVDTQAEFDRILQSRHSSFISWDRVHPNDVGHTALAMAFLRAMEFDFEA